tara:strand:+ start:491 stop:637 length:147 start_codon:yes stop_codon:yes gene_type:complete
MNDGPFLTDKPIEQSGLAYVGTAHQCYPDNSILVFFLVDLIVIIIGKD